MSMQRSPAAEALQRAAKMNAQEKTCEEYDKKRIAVRGSVKGKGIESFAGDSVEELSCWGKGTGYEGRGTGVKNSGRGRGDGER